MSDLPVGWRSVELGNVADACLGKMLDRQKHTAGAQLPYLRNQNVRWFTVDTSDVSEMFFEERELDRYGLLRGDVLVCEGGEPGRAAIWDGRDANMKFQKAIHRIRPSTVLLPQWLVFHLFHDAQAGSLERYFTGTTIKHFTGTALAKYELPLPPLNEQRRIVAKLESLQSRSRRAREALDAVPPLLEKLRQSILAAAFRGDLTKDWRAQNPNPEPASALLARIRTERRQKWEASELAKLKAKGQAPTNDSWKAKYVPADDPVFLNGQPTIPETWAWASVADLTECLDSLRQPITRDKRASGPYPYFGANGVVDSVADYIFDEPLVLVTEDETFYGRTKPIAYRVDGKCWVNNHAHVLRSVRPIPPDFVCQVLMHYPVVRWLSGTTGRAKLTQGALNSLPIALPPLAELVEIEARVKRALESDARIFPYLSQLRELEQRLSSTLLAKAFRGELVPQDPNDEPAHTMLARARNEAPAVSPRQRPRRAKAAE